MAQTHSGEIDVRNGNEEQIPLTVGKWYVGINWLLSDNETGDGPIAQYEEGGEFYDENGELVRLCDYEYLVEQGS